MKRVSGLAAALLTNGCANMTDTQQRTLSGAGLGAAAGTAIGALSGSAGWGAAIGAGVGAAGGYLYDQNQKAKEQEYRRGYSAGQQGR